MAKMGTLAARANQVRNASSSGVRHGPSVKHVTTGGSPKGIIGKGASTSTTSPIKGYDKGGVDGDRKR